MEHKDPYRPGTGCTAACLGCAVIAIVGIYNIIERGQDWSYLGILVAEVLICLVGMLVGVVQNRDQWESGITRERELEIQAHLFGDKEHIAKAYRMAEVALVAGLVVTFVGVVGGLVLASFSLNLGYVLLSKVVEICGIVTLVTGNVVMDVAL